MIIPGLVSATFKTESPDFVLAALKKADLHAVEWSENWHIPAGDTALARDLRERTLAQGAEIAAYGSYYRLGQNSDPAKDFLPTLQSAAALGAPLIRIWGGGTASAELDADTRRELAVEARIVSDMAASEGIKVALEWHKNTVTDTNESGLSFLDEAAADNLYCLWQPIVALNIGQEDSARVADILWEDYGVCVRAGAHCAPLMHKALGTVEQGVVRFSFSHFNTEQEVQRAAQAVCALARELLCE